MRWILGLIVGLTLAGVAWGQQPAPQAPAASSPGFSIPIRQIDDPEKEARERETLEVQRRATVAAERATSASEEALKVARDALWWNWIQVLITGASVIGLIGTIWVGYGSIAAARTQNNIMQEQYVADQRPWLKLSVVSFSFDLEAQKFRATLSVTNIGKSSAKNATFYATVLTNQDSDNALENAKHFVDRCIDIERDASFSFAIMPGSEKTHPTSDEIVMESHDPDTMLSFIFCVVYDDNFGNKGLYVTAGMHIFPNVKGNFFWVANNASATRGIEHQSVLKLSELYVK